MGDFKNDLLRIRLVAAEDEEKITEFFSVMSGEARTFFNRQNENLIAALSFCRNGDCSKKYFLAELDGVMVGLMFFWDYNTSIPWMGLGICENMRGQHIGQQLVAFAQDYARRQGKGGIQLTTHIANLRGQVLYETMGFQKLGIHGLSGEFYYLFRYEDN